jgi:integrase
LQEADGDQILTWFQAVERGRQLACYALDPALGMYTEVGAETGARPSQISKLVVGDLQDGSAPRLMMPSSRKGRGRKPSKRAVPITQSLAAKLERAAADRPVDAPLLRSNGRAWQATDPGDYQDPSSAPPRASALTSSIIVCGTARSSGRCSPGFRFASSPRCTTPACR